MKHAKTSGKSLCEASRASGSNQSPPGFFFAKPSLCPLESWRPGDLQSFFLDTLGDVR